MNPQAPIVPFWHRLREISLYPLQGAALVTLVSLTIARLVHYAPFGWLLNLLIWFAFYKYAVTVLRRTADGRMSAPEVSWEGEDSGWLQVMLQFVFVVFAAIGFLAFGVAGGTLVAIVLSIALPGATMSLAMDEDFLKAINPLTWVAIATRIGWPYLAVAGLCLVISFSEANAQVVVEKLPPVLNVLVFYFIAQYAALVTFHLMGYLIYQYHEELGHEIEAPAARRSLSSDPDQALLDQAESLVREGQTQQAEDLLGAQIRQRGGTPAVHLQYRRLLKLRGDAAKLSAHGRDYIAILLAQQQEKIALDIARDSLAGDPGFVLAQPEQVNVLAQKAVQLGQSQLALQLVGGFHRRYPRHADVAPNALLEARLLADKLGRDRDALTLLAETRDAFIGHPLRSEMETYRSFLESLAGSSRG
ncbi:hypothetical protein [Arenimonas sp.]|uniref:hypothetical protein n=1 Tax=Arenimonas sp. TaxID=1872635 RepID=UPI0039E5FBD6